MTREWRKKERDRARFKRYIRRTLSNKICALALIAVSALGTFLTGEDCALAFALMIAVPMFFAWDKWVY